MHIILCSEYWRLHQSEYDMRVLIMSRSKGLISGLASTAIGSLLAEHYILDGIGTS